MELYRYERGYYNAATLDAPYLFLDTIQVIGETKCGYWIETYTGKRWVASTGKKRYAYPTKQEAYDSFIARTHRCITLLKAQLKQAEGYATAKMPPPDFDIHDDSLFNFVD